tara:strand:+ start:921 stop:1610 length:690 start_codon:yes stop_codon:yes gene_type:complete
MKKLDIDLVSVNTVNPEMVIKAMDYSCREIEFNNSYIFTNKPIETKNHQVIKIDKLNSLDEYSDFLLNFGKFKFKSEYILVIQDDGFIINPKKWNNAFFNYDYIGAPWPKPINLDILNNKEQIAEKAKLNNRVGNGGFSLRSKKFLKFSSQFKTCEGWPEDLFLTSINYDAAIQNNIKFPSAKLAYTFSTETPLYGKDKDKFLDYRYLTKIKSFGFHGKFHSKILKLVD